MIFHVDADDWMESKELMVCMVTLISTVITHWSTDVRRLIPGNNKQDSFQATWSLIEK